MKKPVIMLVDDEPIPEVAMAQAMEHHARTSEFGRLCNLGHVRVMETCDPNFIHCEIEGEVFQDDRNSFPTTELMARLQLAIASGRSCKNDVKVESSHQLDAYAYGFMSETWTRDDAITQGYANMPKCYRKRVTATVKSRQGGLRP